MTADTSEEPEKLTLPEKANKMDQQMVQHMDHLFLFQIFTDFLPEALFFKFAGPFWAQQAEKPGQVNM